MRIPLTPRRPSSQPGPHCVVCRGAIANDRSLRIRGMHFHRGCATYKMRTDRVRR